MKHEVSIDRRESLKLSGLLTLGLAVPPLNIKALQGAGAVENILIVVYDAFSANNVPFYGYPRNTTPNLTRLADRAIVYHNHISTGNFTTPGTASLLTGAYPWTHRAFTLHETVDDSFAKKNLFHSFPNHFRISYTHNPFADLLLEQFEEDIDRPIPIEELFILFDNKSVDALLKSDRDISNVAWLRAFERNPGGYAYSLFFSHFYKELIDRYRSNRLKSLEPDYPCGVPGIENRYFSFEHATDYLIDAVKNVPQPFLGYFHFYPPHAPYTTHKDFYGNFAGDGFQPTDKPEHIFTMGTDRQAQFDMRTDYDEYLLNVDREFGRLYDSLEKSGLLDKTILILTSDHGEMFERGIIKHTTLAMHQPVIRVPLLIFSPGVNSRENIYQTTNAIDILPTLLSIMGQDIPDWCEGFVMPPFNVPGVTVQPTHYSMNIKKNAKYGRLNNGSIVLLKDPYKMVYYYGYDELESEGGELVELYDIYEDPEELINLYRAGKKLPGLLLDELKSKVAEVNHLAG